MILLLNTFLLKDTSSSEVLIALRSTRLIRGLLYNKYQFPFRMPTPKIQMYLMIVLLP